MNEDFDAHGWSHIHHAAFNGYVKSISRFVRSNKELLELLTRDGKKNSPLSLACSNGQLETVCLLIELGASMVIVNADGLGLVELCAIGGHLHVMEYFLQLNSPKVKVFHSLIRALENSKKIQLQLVALKSLCSLVTPERLNTALNVDVLDGVFKVLGSVSSNEDVLLNCLIFLENFISANNHVAPQGMRSDAFLNILIKHLRSESRDVYSKVVRLLFQLATNDAKSAAYISEKGMAALINILDKKATDSSVILDVFKALCLFCQLWPKTQDHFAMFAGFSILVRLMRENKKRKVLTSIARLVALLVEENEHNQNLFINEDGIPALLQVLLKFRSLELQMAIVSAIKSLANNASILTRELLQNKGCTKVLIKILREGPRQDDVRRLVGEALWDIAGSEPARRYTIAKQIGLNILIEFLKTTNASLNLIASEALVVLAEDINSKQDEIVSSSAAQFAVRLLCKDSTPETTVLCVFRAIRALCIKKGFRPHTSGQTSIASDGSIKFLVRFLIDSSRAVTQAEAAYTLACVALGNHEINAMIVHMFEFSRLISLMLYKDMNVRLTTAYALALFAFNNTHNQKRIISSGNLCFAMFKPFLHSHDKKIQAKTAFQVVVLSRIFPDEDQANTSATGIDMLVRLLQQDDESLQASCCNFIAGLSHTRPGIPAAFVSIGAVQILSKLLTSISEMVRCYSAIALGYLSMDKDGQTQLLNICRNNPLLYSILCSYAKKIKLSRQFMERWKHYQRLSSLPPM